VVINALHDKGMPVSGWAHGQLPGCDQRSMALHASTVDLEEAFEVGRHATLLAHTDGTGFMATILREPGNTYRAAYGKVELPEVANFHRQLPASWISDNGIDVIDDFVDYARPLIGDAWAPVPLENGLQRFARLERNFVDPRCPVYLPASYA
jgi:6-phosphofructokinase 1